MNNNARLAGASAPITIMGKEYYLSPLSDVDMHDLDLFVQKRYMDTVYETIPANADPAGRELHIRLGMDNAATLTWMNGRGKAIITTTSGMTHLLWVMLRKRHPDLKEDDFKTALMDPTTLERFNSQFDNLQNGPQGKIRRPIQKANKKRRR